MGQNQRGASTLLPLLFISSGIADLILFYFSISYPGLPFPITCNSSPSLLILPSIHSSQLQLVAGGKMAVPPPPVIAPGENARFAILAKDLKDVQFNQQWQSAPPNPPL